MEFDLINDLATLTTIHPTNLKELAKKSCCIICNDIEEANIEEEKTVTIDIGIGDLQISIEGNKLAYRFVPSSYLKKAITSTILEGKNPLVELAEEKLTNKFLDAYKEYI